MYPIIIDLRKLSIDSKDFLVNIDDNFTPQLSMELTDTARIKQQLEVQLNDLQVNRFAIKPDSLLI